MVDATRHEDRAAAAREAQLRRRAAENARRAARLIPVVAEAPIDIAAAAAILDCDSKTVVRCIAESPDLIIRLGWIYPVGTP